MKYPYGYCGMPCALCSRYRTNGKSKCFGCSFNGFYTDVCKVHHCYLDNLIIHCGKCSDYPCKRLGKMGDFRDLNTNNVKKKTCDFISTNDFEKWYIEYSNRADLLTTALEKYNDGRMKRYLCELFITKDIDVLHNIMDKAKKLNLTNKENGKLFKNIVNNELKLKKEEV